MTEEKKTSLMVETLQEGLSTLRDRPTFIRELQRERYSRGKSFSVERLRVSTDDGEVLEVFFKDLNPLHQLEVARVVRKPSLDRSRCELQMYKHILSKERFGTPQLYTYRWEPKQGTLWLFLEYVGAERLSKLGDFNLWLAAVKWAARFHAVVRDVPAEETAFLVHYDRQHYRHCAQCLEQNLPKFAVQYQPIIKRALDYYCDIMDDLDTLPRTLIHGELYGRNVMIRTSNNEAQIAPIDWETAAIGSPYIDLVSLSAGRWNAEQKRTMWQAYFEHYQEDTGLKMDWQTFCVQVAQVALYQALSWLGWWANGDSAHVARWMRELNKILLNPSPKIS